MNLTLPTRFNWKMWAGVLVGAALGYAYFRLVGCRTGACLITARWYTSTAYGALVGYAVGRTTAPAPPAARPER